MELRKFSSFLGLRCDGFSGSVERREYVTDDVIHAMKLNKT